MNGSPIRLACCVIAAAILLCACAVRAEDARSGPALGSADYRPTPQRSMGWRGDWTGRYPGAEPPLNWSRRVKGITTDLRYQAAKPAGEPGVDSRQLEYFTIRDWLVAGPFAIDDPQKDIARDLLGGEDAISPDAGAKAGSAAWKPVHVNVDTQSRHDHNEGTCGHSYVDFIYAFAKIDPDNVEKIEGDFVNKVAYAHTYIHAPADAKVRLRLTFAGAAARFWINGKPTDLDPKNRDKLYDATLVKGWNRLLVKVSVEKGLVPHYSGQRWISNWMIAAYVEPVLPVSYETRNVAWMTRMTGRSMSQPIVVGDRIFVGCGISDLLCISKANGRILWLRSNTPYDALPAQERDAIPEVKEKIEPLAIKLAQLNDEVVKAINAAVSPQGLSSDEATTLDKKLKDRFDTEQKLHKEFQGIDRKRFPMLSGNEVTSSNATPLCDGQRIYWACGGGMKGTGASVIACYDLDGKRIWSHHEAFGAPEHGVHTSPLLVDGRLIYGVHETLIAFDAASGKVLWRNARKENHFGDTGSPFAARIGDTDVIVAGKALHRAADGALFGVSGLDPWGILTPIREGDMLYNPAQWQGWDAPQTFIALRLPANTSDGAKAETVWKPAGKEVSMPVRGLDYHVASPIYVDGIVYSVEMAGGLTAIDVNARKCLYRQWLDGYTRYNRYLYGVSASPSLGGRNLYIVDDAGFMHVIQPGPAFKELARNVIENIHQSGYGGNPCKQESFYTSPVFDGKSLLLRGEEYLYCIGAP